MPTLANEALADGQPVELIWGVGEDYGSPNTGKVVLDGVERPFTHGKTLRTADSKYPGNEEPTVQVLGVDDDDIVLTGWLLDLVAGARGYALETRDALHKAFLAQRYSKIAWGEAFLAWGYLRAVSFDTRTEGRIKYRITFRVTKTKDSEVLSVPFDPPPSESALVEIMNALKEYAGDAAETAATILAVEAVT